MNADITKLADEVSRGKRSRVSIRREHGDDVYRAVQAELRQRDEASRRLAMAEPREEEEPAPSVEWCVDCETELDTEYDADRERCDECQAKHDAFAWIENTEAHAKALAEQHGWHFGDAGGGFNTRSRYYEVWREVGDDTESFKLRISDHGSAHCTEDISLAMQPSGDDHTMETLAARLAGK